MGRYAKLARGIFGRAVQEDQRAAGGGELAQRIRASGPQAAREFRRHASPSRLVTPMLPPIISTSCLEMASPSPVPPNLRVVDASAWTNAENSAWIWSGRIPIPV